MLVDQEQKSLRERAEELRTNPPHPVTHWQAASVMRSMGYATWDDPPQPMSADEINERVAAFRTGIERRWDACAEYLASIAWPALRFRITNGTGLSSSGIGHHHGLSRLQVGSPAELTQLSKVPDESDFPLPRLA